MAGLSSVCLADRPIRICSPSSSDIQQGNEPCRCRFRFTVSGRGGTAPTVGPHWLTIVSGRRQPVGCLAWAGWATRLSSETLYRVISILLVVIAAIMLLFGHDVATDGSAPQRLTQIIIKKCLKGLRNWCRGFPARVSGGELLIPTLILLFGVDVKPAGSLSLAVSLPTMIVGFARYSQDRKLRSCFKTMAVLYS